MGHGEIEILKKGSVISCERCGFDREYFSRCASCEFLDTSLCECGHLGKKHNIGRGTFGGNLVCFCTSCVFIGVDICKKFRYTYKQFDSIDMWRIWIYWTVLCQILNEKGENN